MVCSLRVYKEHSVSILVFRCSVQAPEVKGIQGRVRNDLEVRDSLEKPGVTR